MNFRSDGALAGRSSVHLGKVSWRRDMGIHGAAMILLGFVIKIFAFVSVRGLPGYSYISPSPLPFTVSRLFRPGPLAGAADAGPG